MFEKYSKEQYQIFLVGNLTKYIKINIINCLSHAKTIMNKQKVLKILNELKPHRELAEWMIALINAWFMDKETYQNMLFMISSVIKKLPDWEEKEKLKISFDDLEVNEINN